MSDTVDSRSAARLPRRPLLAALGVAGLLACGALIFAGSGGKPPAAPVAPPVPVAVAPVEQRDVAHLADAVGTVQSLQSVLLRTQIDGILTELLFQEGDRVAAGQHLASIDDRARKAALTAAEAQLARDTAQLRSAQLDLGRSQQLLERAAASRQTVDQQTAQVDQFRAAIRLAEANVETARVNLSHTKILSPVHGRVGIRLVDAGNLVRMADATGLVSVTQLDPISVVFPVPQQMLAELRASAAAAADGAMVDAVNRETGAVLATGRITAFDNGIDASTGTARVRAEFTNTDERLQPGQFVAVRVRTGRTPAAIVVPATAVRPSLQGKFVYLVKNGIAERVPVEAGYANEQIAVIRGNVVAGDQVVVDGYSRLRPGSKVAVQPGPAKPASTGSGTESVSLPAAQAIR